MSGERDLNELLGNVSQEILDQQCSDRYLADVAMKMVSWESLAPYIEIERQEEHSIRKSCSGYEEEKQEVLFKWKEKNPTGATHRALLEAIHSSGNMDLLHNACQLLQLNSYGRKTVVSSAPPAMSPVLAKFQSRLKDRYRRSKPVMVVEWPPPCSLEYVKLVMLPKDMIKRGEVTNEDVYEKICQFDDRKMSSYQEVSVKQLLACDSDERKVILFEGAPGSGKSTLLWHICQLWQSGEQLQQFNLVLLVQLKDGAFHGARSLGDLLPPRSPEAVAVDIEAVQGEGLLIMLDGWDEAPTKLREKGSFFHSIIAKPADYELEKAVVVVSSRPLSSSDLCVYLSHRVELQGFTKETRDQYIRQSLRDSPDDAQSLIDKIEGVKYSGTMDLSLPLNIASLIHIFCASDGDLPPTPCRIAIMLVLSILYRHIKKTGPDRPPIRELKSFEDLPSPTSDWFHSLCKIAYDGIMDEKFSFTSEDLVDLEAYRSGELASSDEGDYQVVTLGLLQPVHSLMSVGSSTVYHFLHLSHQELCAAYHVSRLPNTNPERCTALESMVSRAYRRMFSFLSVCKFYSAFTSLKTPAIARNLQWLLSFTDDMSPRCSSTSEEMDISESDYSEESEDDVEWKPDHFLFRDWDEDFIITVKGGCGYRFTAAVEVSLESMNIEYIDEFVGKEIRVHVDRHTEGLFSAIVSKASRLESVTYYMHSISPAMFTALRNKESLKKFVLYLFYCNTDCSEFEAMKRCLPSCPNLEDVYIRVRFSEDVSQIYLLTETFQQMQLRNLNIDAQDSVDDSKLAALAPGFVKTACVRVQCKEVKSLGLSKLKDVILQSDSLEYLEIQIEEYGGDDIDLFRCLKEAKSIKTFTLWSKNRGINLHDGEPSVIDSAVGRVLLSGDLVELAEIFGLHSPPAIDKILHVHIFNSCIEVDFKNVCFKSVSLIDCQHKNRRMYGTYILEPIEVKNQIQLDEFQILCKSLQSVAVEELNVSGHKIGNEGAMQFLPSCTMYLKELMLRDCGLGKEGISAILSGLTKFPALTTLDVAYNGFGDGGAVLMAELVNHTSLEVLDISSCGIGEEGIVAIAAALKTNTTLKKLCLYSRGQVISQRSKVEVLRMLLCNRTLSVIQLNQDSRGCPIPFYSMHICRCFRASQASVQTILMDTDPREFYGGIKRSPAIASIGIEGVSPLGQALINDSMKCASEILQLDQPPIAQGSIKVKVDDGATWTVDYTRKSITCPHF